MASISERILVTGLPKRIGSRVLVCPETGCWIWQGYCQKDGYGQVGLGGKVVHVHRLMYVLCVGDLKRRHHVHHKCENPPCCNPNHLEQLPPKDHAKTMDLTNNGRDHREKTSCPQGHPYAESNLGRYKNGRYCKACRRAGRLRRKKAQIQ